MVDADVRAWDTYGCSLGVWGCSTWVPWVAARVPRVGVGVRARASVLAQCARGGDVDDARDELGHLEDVRTAEIAVS